MTDLFAIAFTFFLVANPIGNTPLISALIKRFPFEEQKRIVLREAVFALILALFFQFFGEIFLTLLNISDYTVSFCGGSLLLIIAIDMIFATSIEDSPNASQLAHKPFIVPIATPVIAGPGLLTMIMLYSQQEENSLALSGAIFMAWLGILVVMTSAPYLQRILKKRGLLALEQLMGMIVIFMAVDMIVNGVALFLETLK